MTGLRSQTDHCARTVDATVTAQSEGDTAVLDRTVRYRGGGQPHDTGTLTWNGGTARITEATMVGADIVNTLDGDFPPVGATVQR